MTFFIRIIFEDYEERNDGDYNDNDDDIDVYCEDGEDYYI